MKETPRIFGIERAPVIALGIFGIGLILALGLTVVDSFRAALKSHLK